MSARTRIPRGSAFSWRILGVVAVGGAIGVLLRALMVLPVSGSPDWIVVPAVTLAINIVGSFGLGFVVGLLDDRRPVLRGFLGTGILGGFTTYSAFAVQVAQVGALAPVTGLLLVVLALVVGLLAAALGLRIGRSAAGDPSQTEWPEDAE
jgi:CrcB protein